MERKEISDLFLQCVEFKTYAVAKENINTRFGELPAVSQKMIYLIDVDTG